MKKFYVVLFSIMCFTTVNVLADAPCTSEEEWIAAQNGCEAEERTPVCNSECFLCTDKNYDCLFQELGLDDIQRCSAMKIQEKYEQETLSINEAIQCEKDKLKQMKAGCCKYFDLKKQKRVIKNLKNERQKICDCYEKQFKMILSDNQRSAYNKYKKCK